MVMVHSRSFRFVLLGTVIATGACASSSSSDQNGTGGQSASASGGTQGSGGTVGSGGKVGTGGTVSSGGTTSTGGTVGTGGAPATGGVTAETGGKTGTAGATATGGTAAGGTAAGTGGTSASGGRGGGASQSGGAGGSIDPGTVGDGDFMVGPTYTPSPDLKLKAGAQPGFTFTFDLGSSKSKIFDGTDFNPPLTFDRKIQVWIPSQYVDGTESPFMVGSDGFYGGLQTVVQNMADDPNPDHHVPPLTIVGITNGPDVHPNSERSLEYDTVSDRYWRFVTQEVLPTALAQAALKAKYPNFKFTSDPNGRGGYGCSSGGPAVMGLGWFGDFNRVFSFSGSYVAIQKTTDHPFGAWEYAAMIMAAPLRPDFRVFQEVGEHDNGYTTTADSHSNWVISNTNIAAALAAKGNHHHFVLGLGAGHCDNNARNQVMPDGLVWLWRGYKAP
jgi:enterochelin esterase-like enzyme